MRFAQSQRQIEKRRIFCNEVRFLGIEKAESRTAAGAWENEIKGQAVPLGEV